jgi:hypothetical protein
MARPASPARGEIISTALGGNERNGSFRIGDRCRARRGLTFTPAARTKFVRISRIH